MSGRLTGKTAIVTGGATGIGEAISKKFAREGARVVVATTMGRRGTTEEIANAYLFLASEEASYITGKLFSVGGGTTISKGSLGSQIPEELSQQA